MFDHSAEIKLAIVIDYAHLKGHNNVARYFLTYTTKEFDIGCRYYIYYKGFDYVKDGLRKSTNYAASILIQENNLLSTIDRKLNNGLERPTKTVIKQDIQNALLSYNREEQALTHLPTVPEPIIVYGSFDDHELSVYDRLLAAASAQA